MWNLWFKDQWGLLSTIRPIILNDYIKPNNLEHVFTIMLWTPVLLGSRTSIKGPYIVFVVSLFFLDSKYLYLSQENLPWWFSSWFSSFPVAVLGWVLLVTKDKCRAIQDDNWHCFLWIFLHEYIFDPTKWSYFFSGCWSWSRWNGHSPGL